MERPRVISVPLGPELDLPLIDGPVSLLGRNDTNLRQIERNLPEMVRAAGLLGAQHEFLLPVASTIDDEWLRGKIPTADSNIRLVKDARATLSLARASVVASGTATVEAALAGNPFVVVYRVSALSWTLGRRLMHVDNFAMPNLIAGKTIVPELIQHAFTAEKIVQHINRLLLDGYVRQQMMADLSAIRAKLHGPATNQTAA